jgi:hypothetical protein
MNRVAVLRRAQECLAGRALALLVVGSLPPTAYSKDLQQEYLTASAWRDGLSIFTPLADLSALAAAVCLSRSLPLVNFLARLGARPSIGSLLAMQSAGMLGLLVLSLTAARADA